MVLLAVPLPKSKETPENFYCLIGPNARRPRRRSEVGEKRSLDKEETVHDGHKAASVAVKRHRVHVEPKV